MAEFKDFDEAIQADKEENVQFKVAGREYSLPATLPAKVVLTQMRYTSEGNEIPMNVRSLMGVDCTLPVGLKVMERVVAVPEIEAKVDELWKAIQ